MKLTVISITIAQKLVYGQSISRAMPLQKQTLRQRAMLHGEMGELGHFETSRSANGAAEVHHIAEKLRL